MSHYSHLTNTKRVLVLKLISLFDRQSHLYAAMRSTFYIFTSRYEICKIVEEFTHSAAPGSVFIYTKSLINLEGYKQRFPFWFHLKFISFIVNFTINRKQNGVWFRSTILKFRAIVRNTPRCDLISICEQSIWWFLVWVRIQILRYSEHHWEISEKTIIL